LKTSQAKEFSISPMCSQMIPVSTIRGRRRHRFFMVGAPPMPRQFVGALPMPRWCVRFVAGLFLLCCSGSK